MLNHATAIACLASAAVASVLTAAIILAFAGSDAPSSDTERAPANISAASTEIADRISQSPPIEIAAELDNGFVRSAVDWSAVYAKAAPSLVSIMTTDGAGAGFFVSEQGHVITNLHVVNGASEIVVVSADGETFDAEILARDVGNDLALLEVEIGRADIEVPTFADVEELRVGEPVGALGAPYGLSNTLTVGIISALDRTRPSTGTTHEPLRNLIQTDTALNPGNSGGMLVDAYGRLIGVPTQIESPDRGSSGIGFAVSADAVLEALPVMLSGDDVERAFLGVQLMSGVDEPRVSDVACNSAAHSVGVRDGDVIREIGGEPIVNIDDLVQRLREISPGDPFTLTVSRSGRLQTLNAVARAWPSTAPFYGCG